MHIKQFLSKLLIVSTVVTSFTIPSYIPSFAGTNDGVAGGVATASDGFTFDFMDEPDPEQETEDVEINIKNTIEYVDVAGEKIWKGDDDVKTLYRPENITIHLYADGVDTNKSVTTGADENWRYSFSNLDKYSEGEPITYTVKEDTVDNYVVSYSGGEADWYESENEIIVLNTTNTFKTSFTPKFPDEPGAEPGKYLVNVKGKKFWNDDDDRQGMRPDDITIHLYRDGVDTGLSTSTDASKDWAYSFDDLDKYDYEGDYHEYEYSVKEDVPKGYIDSYETVEHEPDPPKEEEEKPTPPPIVLDGKIDNPSLKESPENDQLKVTFLFDDDPIFRTRSFNNSIDYEIEVSGLGTHTGSIEMSYELEYTDDTENEAIVYFDELNIDEDTIPVNTSLYDYTFKITNDFGSFYQYSVDITGNETDGFVVKFKETGMDNESNPISQLDIEIIYEDEGSETDRYLGVGPIVYYDFTYTSVNTERTYNGSVYTQLDGYEIYHKYDDELEIDKFEEADHLNCMSGHHMYGHYTQFSYEEKYHGTKYINVADCDSIELSLNEETLSRLTSQDKYDYSIDGNMYDGFVITFTRK